MRRFLISLVSLLGFWQPVFAEDIRPEVLSVWVSEAGVALYTLDASNLQAQQSALSYYFSSQGWIDFNKAQEQSGILQAIQTHRYTVRAIPLHPPKIMALDPQHWEAILPILVSYTNPEYEQQQTLRLKIRFEQSTDSRSVRGFAISAIESKKTSELCTCRPKALPKQGN